MAEHVTSPALLILSSERKKLERGRTRARYAGKQALKAKWAQAGLGKLEAEQVLCGGGEEEGRGVTATLDLRLHQEAPQLARAAVVRPAARGQRQRADDRAKDTPWKRARGAQARGSASALTRGRAYQPASLLPQACEHAGTRVASEQVSPGLCIQAQVHEQTGRGRTRASGGGGHGRADERLREGKAVGETESGLAEPLDEVRGHAVA
eukprot:scaffold539_cov359-Prasinococcus_capsulatus_cf.AAC.17